MSVADGAPAETSGLACSHSEDLPVHPLGFIEHLTLLLYAPNESRYGLLHFKGEEIGASFRCRGQKSALPLVSWDAPGMQSKLHLSHEPEGKNRRKWTRLAISEGCELLVPGRSEWPTPW